MSLSKTRLERISERLQEYVERGAFPGAVALVARRGEVHVDAVGALALGGGAPMARDTIFRVSSMSKPVTAVATMVLVEEAKLRLDDPVDDLLPELANRAVLRRVDGPLDETVPAERSITTRDLLTFRSGYGMLFSPAPFADALEALGQGFPRPAIPPAPDEWIARIGELPLVHQPGERWVYNTASDILGVLVARASGQPFDVFLRERVFEPLGMRDTGFFVTEQQRPRFATSYTTDPETGALELNDPPDGQWSSPPRFPSGANGLVSTVDDFAAFGDMLLNPDGRVLSRASVDLMTTDHLTPEQKATAEFVPGFFENRGWGFGVSVVTRATDLTAMAGAFGWDGGLGTLFQVDPAAEMVTVLLTQASFTSPEMPAYGLDFRTLAYAAIDD